MLATISERVSRFLTAHQHN